jgi:DNA-binding beta-propeller fold protein YncE
MSNRARLFAVLFLASAALPAVAAEAPYRLTHAIKLGGTPRWDYVSVDATSRRAFIAHAEEVTVIDLARATVAGRVTGLAGAHGVAIVPALGRGFVANGDRNTLAVFGLDDLNVQREVPVGKDPDSVTYDPASKRIFVFNGEDKNATVLDAASLDPVGTVEFGATPEFAVADGRGSIFVNLEEPGEIGRIDTASAKLVARHKIEGCEEPHALALDPAKRRLYSSCANKVLAVVEADSGRTLAQVPIGRGSDAAVFDAKRNLVYVSNGEGFVSVIDAATNQLREEVQTRVTGRTMALDPADAALLVPAVEFEIDWTARTAKFAPDGLTLYRFARTVQSAGASRK